MSTLSIDRLHARYHEVTADELATLDRALSHVVGDALDTCCSGRFDVEEFAICIEELEVDIALDLSGGASSAGQQWADQLVRALSDHLAGGGAVVRYPRELDAVRDVCISFAAGDDRRAWAWRQSGIVPASGEISADVVTQMLAARPELVPAVLASIEHPFVIPLTHAGWARVAQAAARGHAPAVEANRRRHLVGAEHVEHSDPEADVEVHVVSFGALGRLRRRLRSTALREVWEASGESTRADLVQLVLLVIAPHLARHRATHLWVANELASGSALDVASENEEQAATTEVSELDRVEDAPFPPYEARWDVDGDEVQPRLDRPDELARAEHGAGPERADWMGGSDAVSAVDGLQPEPIDSVPTRNAGVLFLVHAIMELGELANEVAAHRPATETASPMLARLLAGLTGVAVTDPAVLLAAGYRLGDLTPDDVNEVSVVLTDERTMWLDQRIEEVSDWLVRRLGPDGSDETSWLWQRPGLIRQEPGWIDVELRLDSVDLRARAAGLDLDPGFVWWLGAILRFRYV